MDTVASQATSPNLHRRQSTCALPLYPPYSHPSRQANALTPRVAILRLGHPTVSSPSRRIVEEEEHVLLVSLVSVSVAALKVRPRSHLSSRAPSFDIDGFPASTELCECLF